MIDELQKNLLNGDFEIAEKIFQRISFDDARSMITKIAGDTGNILTYTFAVSLLLKERKSAKLHLFASQILSTALEHLEGAYIGGLYHIRKCIELDPNNIDYKEVLLTFYALPDQLISKDEATKIALEVLAVDPDNYWALRVIT